MGNVSAKHLGMLHTTYIYISVEKYIPMMGNVSAKQLGMLHTICMYVCMYGYLHLHAQH